MEDEKKTSQQRLADQIRKIPESDKQQAFSHVASYLEGYMAGVASARSQSRTV